MDPDRLRWITSKPTLDRWDLGVRFSRTPTGLLATYTAQGWSDRKRGALWTHGDTCPTGGDTFDLHDRLWALASATSTHQPATETDLLRALTGEVWEQQEFPF